MQRWWTYQRERFPLAAYGPLVAVFSLGALGHSARLRDGALPEWPAGVVAFVVVLGVFLLLRIADEFKDAEKDARYRPYRPVPRGLVSLRELGGLGAATAATQLGLALWLDPQVTFVLLAVWAYVGLMSVEFFVPDWLEPRLGLYAASHMGVLPLIALVATACDWAVAGARPPATVGWFLAASYANGLVLEVGRKIRAPEGEETGVETYSKRWGRPLAVAAWGGALLAAGLLSVVAAEQVGAGPWAAGVLGTVGLGAGGGAGRFLSTPTPARAGAIEQCAGVWLLASYGSMGLLPLAVA
ncbi:MAG: UbiA family prenyltransferase [Salinibacter sp.]